ncbi:hypothetical protein NDU88_005246 [Pleurodeles waltl]|uniref:Uncharacterized protein n=1 Tax=Pleurodeles waltl TaxID=8319 RepID=A0AAV7LP00_PLEWA|nr:hypothetical protein NDU88_005246 [Pleurodeles waltl]
MMVKAIGVVIGNGEILPFTQNDLRHTSEELTLHLTGILAASGGRTFIAGAYSAASPRNAVLLPWRDSLSQGSLLPVGAGLLSQVLIALYIAPERWTHVGSAWAKTV